MHAIENQNLFIINVINDDVAAKKKQDLQMEA